MPCSGWTFVYVHLVPQGLVTSKLEVGAEVRGQLVAEWVVDRHMSETWAVC